MYINVLVDDPDVAEAGREILFEDNIICHIMMMLSGKKLRKANKGKPRLIDANKYVPVQKHMSNFVNKLIGLLPNSIRSDWKNVPRRTALAMCEGMLVSMKEHVFRHFENCVPKHLRCLLEEKLWQHLDETW